MFGIGMPEMMVILVVALIVIGPTRLPEIARSLGKGYAEFARSFRDVKRGFEDFTDEFEHEANAFRNPAETIGKVVENNFAEVNNMDMDDTTHLDPESAKPDKKES